MTNDSEEKILEDYNKLMKLGTYHATNLDGFTIRVPGEETPPAETDMGLVYRKLEGYAKGHGEKIPKKNVNEAQDRNWRQKMKAIQKNFMSLWIRAKKLRKAKKGLDLPIEN